MVEKFEISINDETNSEDENICGTVELIIRAEPTEELKAEIDKKVREELLRQYGTVFNRFVDLEIYLLGARYVKGDWFDSWIDYSIEHPTHQAVTKEARDFWMGDEELAPEGEQPE